MTQREYNEFSDEPGEAEYHTEYPAEYDELFFDDDEPPEVGEQLPDTEIARQQPPRRAHQAGLTGASVKPDTANPSTVSQGSSTLDDATPETLIPDDGARSPREADGKTSGEATATDQRLSKTSIDNIGAGAGLDEAELGRAQPLDERPWDGDPGEPLTPRPTTGPERSHPNHQ